MKPPTSGVHVWRHFVAGGLDLVTVLIPRLNGFALDVGNWGTYKPARRFSRPRLNVHGYDVTDYSRKETITVPASGKWGEYTYEAWPTRRRQARILNFDLFRRSCWIEVSWGPIRKWPGNTQTRAEWLADQQRYADEEDES